MGTPRLEALHPAVDVEGGEIDPLIVPLVNALTERGLSTFASCQGGHPNQPYPWVSFRLPAQTIQQVMELLPMLDGWEIAVTWLPDFGGFVGTLQPVAYGGGGTAKLAEIQRRIPSIASALRCEPVETWMETALTEASS